jgi:putative membrane protein insertion efficiency factor
MSSRTLVLGLLNAYKRWISPLLPPACRFHPTCSDYARDAVTLHGVWRGVGLTSWRLLRCQPFSRGGFDPVPEKSGSRGRVAG